MANTTLPTTTIDDALVYTTTFPSSTQDAFATNTTAWLSTTASQIFFMQLGFLCYEVGYVKPVWTQSVILKNIEDTFVGILTFLAFGYTLAESNPTLGGIISVPNNPLLIGIDILHHDQILISAFFASTCATIISGAVLERMKNKAYIVWCLLTILVNYSFIAHWVWHKEGWLAARGFVDGAGSVVVHSTAGMAALVAVWKLGPRRDSLDADGHLLPEEHAANPIVNAIGAFFLWYGWFAFNVSSPIAFSKGIGDAIGTTALVTVISPISSSCASFLWMHLGYVKLSFESLLSCLLSGLVAITGMCHTCNVWEATVIGFFSSVVYFGSAHVIRYKLQLDDPLQVIAIHLACGIYSGIMEGIVANDTYGTPGIIHSGSFKHFGVQLLGVFCIVLFNLLVSLFLYDIILARCIFRKIDMRVSILDIYLGTRLFDQNYDMALREVLNCNTNVGKQMLWEFHYYMEDRYASEQLDFLLVTEIYNHYLKKTENIDKTDKYQAAKYILRIVTTYVDENGNQCINVSAKQRAILYRIKNQLLSEIKHHRIKRDKKEKQKEKENKGNDDDDDDDDEKDIERNEKHMFLSNINPYGLDITRENVFNSVAASVWKLVIPHFTHFLQHSYNLEKKTKFNIKIPFKLSKNWDIVWDKALEKESEGMQLADTVPQYNNSGTLLSKMLKQYDEEHNEKANRTSSGLHEIQLTTDPKHNDDDVDYEPPIVIKETNETQSNFSVIIQ